MVSRAQPAGVPAPPVPRSTAIAVVAGLAFVAGVIHAKAFVDHVGHYWLYGVFFGTLTCAQVLWSVWIYRRPDDRRALVAGALVSLAVVAVWLVSRTTGVPVGPFSGRPEPVGVSDTMATVDELVLAAYVVAIVRPRGRLDALAARLTWLTGEHCVRIGVMLISASLFAALVGGHTHHEA